MSDGPKRKYIDVNTMTFHYLEWETLSSRTMVLLHGIGDNAHIWDYFARSLAGHMRIIALDQRGHGSSDWALPPAYRCEDYVADLHGVMAALELNDVILMGHSMGALHATRYAALCPDNVAGLIHADIEPCPPDWNKKYLFNLYNNLPDSYDSLEAYVRQMKNDSPYADESLLRYCASLALYRDDEGRFRCQYDREVLYHFDRYDLRPYLGDITCPTLIIRGEESRVMKKPIAEEMSRAITGSTWAEISRATHPVHTDNLDEFQRVVVNFLRKNNLIAR